MQISPKKKLNLSNFDKFLSCEKIISLKSKDTKEYRKRNIMLRSSILNYKQSCINTKEKFTEKIGL